MSANQIGAAPLHLLHKGIKAMMYLDDVDASNGPFAMLLGYQDRQLVWAPDVVSGVRRRLNQSEVNRAVSSGSRVENLYARMGSVIIFEISNAHRGMPCKSGERVSLTNYYKVSKASTTCAVGQNTSAHKVFRRKWDPHDDKRGQHPEQSPERDPQTQYTQNRGWTTHNGQTAHRMRHVTSAVHSTNHKTR